jgi:O-antigen ligase
MAGYAPHLSLRQWSIPQSIYVLWAVLLTLSLFLKGISATLVVTLVLVVALAFFIEGCAVLQCGLKRVRAGAFLAPLILGASFFVVPAIMLVIVGVLEPVMHFRRRFGCG